MIQTRNWKPEQKLTKKSKPLFESIKRKQKILKQIFFLQKRKTFKYSILDQGSQVNKKADTVYGDKTIYKACTALHVTWQTGIPQIAHYLIEKGTDN